MSDKVTPQRVAICVEEIRALLYKYDGNWPGIRKREVDDAVEYLHELEAACIKPAQQLAPAPVETVGWKTEYECLSAHDKWYPVTVLVEDSAIKRFIEARESEKSITRNIRVTALYEIEGEM